VKLSHVAVLGSGSAGLIAALSLKKKLPQLKVTILRSSEIGIIGVGEGTTPNFGSHLFEYLGMKRKDFYREARPTWKLGIRFLWGARGRFDYTFDRQLEARFRQLSLANGYYCTDEWRGGTTMAAACMRADKAFPVQPNGCPDFPSWFAFHIENERFVKLLERLALQAGVQIKEGRMQSAHRAENGDVISLALEDGGTLAADFFIDSSGFRSELIGKVMGAEFESFKKSLFCDRAVVGGWKRGELEKILPYTTAEQMEAGWCWQIEHEEHVNRGYVFSSDHLTDEQATEEFLRKNPRAPESPRIVKFRSGAYKQQWVNNVAAIGNSAGFVEPLEATALMLACGNTQTLVDLFIDSDLTPSDACRKVFNLSCAKGWTDIKNFLALHYWADRSKQNAFWDRCRNETDTSEMQDLLDFYQLHGPSGALRQLFTYGITDFGLEGWLNILVGNKVPHQGAKPSKRELDAFREFEEKNLMTARTCMDVKTALQYVHHPGWSWNADQMAS
jgi:tryptophan 7-halogenase